MRDYRRVIPRDLFNEGNLLKCLGALYIATEGMKTVSLEYDAEDEPFDVQQDQDDGSLYCVNVRLLAQGRQIHLCRSLNARSPYPLFAAWGEEWIQVFNDDGSLTPEFRGLIDEP